MHTGGWYIFICFIYYIHVYVLYVFFLIHNASIARGNELKFKSICIHSANVFIRIYIDIGIRVKQTRTHIIPAVIWNSADLLAVCRTDKIKQYFQMENHRIRLIQNCNDDINFGCGIPQKLWCRSVVATAAVVAAMANIYVVKEIRNMGCEILDEFKSRNNLSLLIVPLWCC